MKTNHPLNRNFWNPALLLPGLWLLFSFVGEKIPAIPENLTVNLRKTPVGIESNPCFSWESGVVRQNACQIVVALSPEDLQDQKYVWNSGKVISGKDFQIPYKGPVLQSATRYYWQVRVWNEKNIMAESKPSWWETGLLKPEDWEPAQWIGGRDPQDHNWKDMTATVRFRITEARAGISFLFHAEPVGKTWGEAYVWKLAASKEAGKVELSMKTSHFAGNTGVPRPGPGDPAVDWGVNYFDPQGVINPLKTGTRIVDLATRTAENAGGLSHDNLLTADHELKVRVTGDEVTTWIDGVLADQRTLSGDQLREQGSIGFESGSNAVIRSVRVESSKIDGGNGTANDFYTDFAGGYNPFEDGMVRWTGIKGDSSTEGLVLMPGRGIMLPVSNPAPLLRKEFSVAGSPVVAARLFIAGGGYPRVMVNGIPVTTDGALPDENGFNITHLTPGDGQSETFILYNTFDVTRFINSGKTNALAVELGRGWTGLTIPSEWFWNLIPTHADPRTRIKLIITHLDGKQEEIVSDENWKTTDGPVLFNSVASGEKYDAGKAKSLDGWKMAGFDDRSWNPVTRVNPMGSYYGTGKYHALVPTTGLLPEGFVESRLQAMENEPIVVRETLKPVAILETWPGSGVFLFKFAQMHSGWPMLHLKGLRPEQAGLTLRIRGDNIIKGNGTKEEPYALSDNSRFHAGTIQTDYYILSDDAEQVWSPAFHYNGQGAVEVHGLRNVLGRAPDMEHDSDLITAEVASSGLQMNSVNTDNPLLNRIFSLCQWTMLNNAHGHPTDTPSREKNGWTGDGWADAEAWMNNFDMSQFYRLWVRDMAAGMNPDGDLNVVMPGPRAYGFDNTPGWSMANGAVPAWDLAFFEVPFDLYRYYGDEAILKEVFPMQEKFMDYYTKRFTKESHYTFKNPFLGEYAPGVLKSGGTENINHQLYFRMADYMAKTAEILGFTGKAESYRRLADDVVKEFIQLYWDENTHSFQKGNGGNPETEQILAAAFDMVPGNDLPANDPRYLATTSNSAPQNRKSCMDWVARSIQSNGNRIGTGIYGLHYLFNLLDDYGYTNLAYAVATGLENPSWGNILLQGGSTLQENWGGIDGNHHYHSSIVTWYYQGLAGIRPSSPGYATVRIKPHVPTNMANSSLKGDKADLSHVSAEIKTARGLVKSAWITGDQFILTVTIPGNTPTEVWVPSMSGKLKKAPRGAIFLRTAEGYAIYKIGAGSWEFQSHIGVNNHP